MQFIYIYMYFIIYTLLIINFFLTLICITTNIQYLNLSLSNQLSYINKTHKWITLFLINFLLLSGLPPFGLFIIKIHLIMYFFFNIHSLIFILILIFLLLNMFFYLQIFLIKNKSNNFFKYSTLIFQFNKTQNIYIYIKKKINYNFFMIFLLFFFLDFFFLLNISIFYFKNKKYVSLFKKKKN